MLRSADRPAGEYDATRFTNADIIYNLDTDGADKDKITVQIDSGNYAGAGILVDDRFNIIVVDGDGTHKKDATIYEAMAKNVLAVVSDVGDFDWSAIIIEDENSASLSNATLAHLPDIA